TEDPSAVATPAFLTSDASLTWLANQAPVGVFDLDFQLGYARYSPTWKQLLGYTDSDLADTYDTWRRLLHPEDSAAAPDRVGKYPLNASRRSFVLEFRMQHRRGHYVWMQCMGEQHFGPAGELQRV
ncbi:MAG TPA: PAS domain-containing protein, partial [Opitutaceae bacterium]|nr:PAS domain-containing protein [Opitutaceae bacterium]